MQITDLKVSDETATPVTLVAVSADSKGAIWRSNLPDVSQAAQLRLTVVWEQLKNGSWRGSAKLEVPSMETTAGGTAAGYEAAPAVAYVTTGIFTMFASPRSTAQDRANVVRMMTQLLSGANATDAGLLNSAAANVFTSVTADKQIGYMFANEIPPA